MIAFTRGPFNCKYGYYLPAIFSIFVAPPDHGVTVITLPLQVWFW